MLKVDKPGRRKADRQYADAEEDDGSEEEWRVFDREMMAVD